MPLVASKQTRVNNFRSQYGEDRILARIFARIPTGTCVEVGAHNGVDLSNTYYFEQIGWRCILVEPNPVMWAVIRETRRAVLFECAASGHESQAILHAGVGDGNDVLSTLDAASVERIKQRGAQVSDVPVRTRRLDDMLEESRVERLDFVSIDVEGHELDVLQGFDLNRWKPQFVILEDNSNLRESSVVGFMLARGYTRFFRTGCNDWYTVTGTWAFATFRGLLTCGPWDIAKGLIKARLPGGARFGQAIKRAVKRLIQRAPRAAW
jgi:FkbM family methyltransferase